MELFGMRRRWKISPIILAIIFIGFLQNVLGKNRIRHYRDRFKRQQGAHLYLPGSYVTSGEDASSPDAGPWGEWSPPTPCSRTCGGGVATQTRRCTVGFECRGPAARHFSCNTQDCPDSSDYREQQCAEHNNAEFEGVYYEWVPYTKAPNECELNCMPRGERFYYRFQPAAVDGTRCNEDTFDVCVQGECKPVGCDRMLGSSAREDLCRVCGGDGSSCNTFDNEIPMKDMQVGYNDILFIPAGATNIRVEEIGPSNNYLAVRNTSGHYYLNGNWRIDFPRTLEFAGCKFKYERFPQGFAAPDIITCLGPTEESLFIVLLYQDQGVSVHYTYSLPTNIPPPSNETYAWTYDEFTPCSATCGGGYQYRNVTCAGRNTLEPADSTLCDTNNEPEGHRRCNEIPCPAQWVPYPWKECSAPCGEGGVQTRDVFCQQIVSNGQPTLVNDTECEKQGQRKPDIEQKCNVGKICAKWHEGPWKPCDHLCGPGKETRKVLCYIEEDGKKKLLEDSECEALQPKPETEKSCNVRPCKGVDWMVSEWTGCERICGLESETRKVNCADEDGVFYSDDLCDQERKPETVRKCETTNATCEYLWYASQWSECSVKCGPGVQTRTLFCGVVTPEGVKKAENDKCDQSKHFETIKNCTGEMESCEGEWFSGPWSDCSVKCGGGSRKRKVVCIKDNNVVDPLLCGSSNILFSDEDCNKEPCSDDAIMSTDVTHPIDESDSTSAKEWSSVATTVISTDKTEEPEFIPEEIETDDDEEYEIVPDTNCDDGEWIDVTAAQLRYEPQLTTSSPLESDKTESPLTMDDLMLSDGTTVFDEEETSLDTGSGYSELTSAKTGGTTVSDFEGSGTGSDALETGSSYITDSGSSGSTFEVSGSTGGNTESEGSSLKPESTTEISMSTTLETSDMSTSGGSSLSSDLTTGEVSGSTTEISGSTTEVSGSTTEVSGSTTEVSGSTTEVSGTASEFSASTREVSGSTTDESKESTTVSEFTSTSGSSDETTPSGSTDVSPTSTSESSTSSGSTETTESTITETTESTITETTESTITESTESTITETTESTITDTTETGQSTDTSKTTESTEITESTVTESTFSTDMSTTESSESTTSQSDLTTVSGTEETSSSTDSTFQESITTTDASSSVEDIINLGESEQGKPIYGIKSTEQSIETSEQTTEISGSTQEAIESTTQSIESTLSSIESTGTSSSFETTASSGFTSSSEGYTESTSTGSTEISGSTELSTGSTETSTESTGSTESPGSTETSTESTGSTETSTEFTGSTESITEFTGTTESDIFTSEMTTIVSETTEELYGTTSVMELFAKKPRMCKRRKIMACKKTKYGCCWDKITPASGPFDAGCPTPKTCKESKYGCCEDGVSAALGPKNRGCPPSHCNETLFGCCKDNKTIAEGNDYEGCPPDCLLTEFGCCDDNITVATGPEHQGCDEYTTESTTEDTTTELTTEITTESTVSEISPETTESMETSAATEPSKEEDCHNTTYRCCPDNQTPATGPRFQGCNLPCSNATFGCCQDGATPAHGPSGEGCCLSSRFGCCPDNVIPARGPNLEGCDCQNSLYGCCPDNTTSARGYNKEGCGCKHATYGCCPDDFTPADGPNYAGCLCHTFQFGCCPDGVTTAQGPHQQGCGCRNSEFGCCSDDQTPSPGPNMEGCTCENSKYGCCLDGVTEAKGEGFEGCDTAPVNLQAGCGVPKERGSCRNYTVKWFFDMDYGGCSRFWYGGCGGNANRYKSKEECEQICIQPQGKDVCNLPKVAGPCEGYYPMWYYDKNINNCAQLIYGGCLGNKNRFETREECLSLCVIDTSVDACEQSKEEGPCQGQYRRFYFDKDTGKCEMFTYGGCKGNNNNFKTIEACEQKCAAPGRKKDHCSLPRAQGGCNEKLPRWYYNTPEKRCVPFYYSGCDGNQNNFNTKEECERDCPADIIKDTCQLPAETGECANYVDRWYYDTKAKTCRQFYYGGCGGNDNNFQTERSCQDRCVINKVTTSPEVTVPQPEPEPFNQGMCFLPSETGNCRGNYVRFYYDRSDGVCKSFTYGGCQGNGNNFESMEECLQHCGASQDLCTLPPIVGACNGEYLQYYYDFNTDECLPFNYGGCGGNYNRFQDKSSCEQRCRRAKPDVPATQAPPVSSDISMCYRQVDPGNCTDSEVAFFFDPEKRVCKPFTYTGCEGNDNRFNSEEQCERQCGTFRGQDVCNVERDPGPCRGYFVKYYYDRNTGRCEQFAWGGCQGNGNRFSSSEECEHICVTHDETKPNITSTAICQLPVDKGSCTEGYHKRWYFDDARGECLAFIYSGCGGNFNNFKSFQSCLEFCKQLLPVTEPPPVVTDLPQHPCQEVFDECTTLRCAYGVEPYVDENECNRCRCRNPCINVQCLDDESCAIDINRNKSSSRDADFIAICRKRIKPGLCPTIDRNDNYCEEECRTDADCTLHLKCCSTGCGTSCVDPPGQLITQQPEEPAYTIGPIETAYQPPKVDPVAFEPEVHALIGDQATLKCAVSGNPNPRIKWRKDSLEIDGTQPRYRIKLDQSLQIITLHKTDSGIYLCTADNGIGDPVTNEIKLDVLDSEPRSATILDPDDEPPVIVSLNAPTTLNCYALGFPFPAITWWKDNSLIPYKNNEFEIREDYSLLIHSVKLQNLGIYTCQAYNGFGKAASWAVTVKAQGPYHFTNSDEVKYKQFIVEPPEEPTTTTALPPPPPPLPPSRKPPQRPTPEPYQPQINYTEPSNEIQPEGGYVSPSIIVPVRANITTNDQRYPVGSNIDLPCAVIGFPLPQVQWYKDGIAVYPSDRITISESNTLSIREATKADSGNYQCEATNAYYKASSTIEILIEGMYIHPNCTDNQFFANCALIVKAKICTHRYYAKFCCRSCTEAGLLPVDGPHLNDKNNAILGNLI